MIASVLIFYLLYGLLVIGSNGSLGSGSYAHALFACISTKSAKSYFGYARLNTLNVASDLSDGGIFCSFSHTDGYFTVSGLTYTGCGCGCDRVGLVVVVVVAVMVAISVNGAGVIGAGVGADAGVGVEYA